MSFRIIIILWKCFRTTAHFYLTTVQWVNIFHHLFQPCVNHQEEHFKIHLAQAK